MPRAWFKAELKLDVEVPAAWMEKFNRGSTPVADRTAYPSKAELIAALEQTHAVIAAGLLNMTETEMQQPASERIRHRFPLVGDAMVGLVTTHEALHVGQLSAWRRAMGMKPLF